MSDTGSINDTLAEITARAAEWHRQRVEQVHLLELKGSVYTGGAYKGAERNAITVSCAACGRIVLLHLYGAINKAEARDALRSRFGWHGTRRSEAEGGWLWHCPQHKPERPRAARPAEVSE